MRKFKTGNVVRLNSGGQQMTVQNYHTDDSEDKRLTCVWFYDGELKSGTFYEDQLELLD